MSNKNGKLVCSLFNVHLIQVARGSHQSRGGDGWSRRRRDGAAENSQKAAILSTQVETEQGGGRGGLGAYSEDAKVTQEIIKTIFLNLRVRTCRRQTKDHKNHSFLPFRLLLTSSKAVRRLLRRNEMHGWNQRALDQEAHDQRVVANIRWLHSSFTCGILYLITGWLHSSLSLS